MGFGGGNGFSPSRTIVEDSTKTGNDASQKHQFTGSVEISGGPLKLNGASITAGGGALLVALTHKFNIITAALSAVLLV